MVDVTIVDNTEEPEPEPTVETPEVSSEAAEVIADRAVEVAQIEADRDVKVAEIQADVVKEHDSDVVEAIRNEDEEWRQNIEARIAAQETQNSEILSTLQTLTQSLQNPPENSENPEVIEESQEAPEPPAPKKRPHHRLI